MMKSSVPPNDPVALPPLVAAYVEATNSFDLERLLAIFAEDALVNDQLRDYWGKPAIREWAKHDIIGESLTMNVTKVINHYGNFIATARERNWDRTFSRYSIECPRIWADWVGPKGAPSPPRGCETAILPREGCRATTSKLWPLPPSADRGPLPQLKGGDAEYPLQTQPRDRAGIHARSLEHWGEPQVLR